MCNFAQFDLLSEFRMYAVVLGQKLIFFPQYLAPAIFFFISKCALKPSWNQPRVGHEIVSGSYLSQWAPFRVAKTLSGCSLSVSLRHKCGWTHCHHLVLANSMQT